MTSSEPSTRPARPPRLLLAASLLVAGCAGDAAVLSFADYLGHQQDNATTGLVSVADGVNTHLLGHGWAFDASEPAYAELTETIGHVRFFSARGELRRLRLRAASSAEQSPQSYRVLLNGKAVGTLAFGADGQEQLLGLPPRHIRAGHNLLALRCLACPVGAPRRGPTLRLQQIRLEPAAVQSYRIRRTEHEGGRGFYMPVPAFLDLVAELPAAARFDGLASVSAAAPGAVVAVSLRLLDAAADHTVAEWQLGGGRQPRRLQADLGAWSRRLVRLRLGVEPGEAVEVAWQRAVITGRHGTPRGGRLSLVEPAAPPRSARLGRPDLIMILLDAARADAFRPFGGPYPSPALERLAADGTRFTEAHSPSSWTRQSVPALLTGFHAGAIDAGAWGSGLDLRTPTLAELLAAAGYRTQLWHEHPYYRGQPELQRGFVDSHWMRRRGADGLPPQEVLFAGDHPAFTFLHLIPPHAPYEPPAPFRGAYSSWFPGSLDVSAAALNRYHDPRRSRRLTADERRYVRDRYLENAAWADSLVGRVLELLDAAGRYDDSMIVVLSDHGESFLEHGRFLHTQQLYRESTHVPLIFKWPANAGPHRSVVELPVSLVDLVPTLVDGLALGGGHAFQGRSLLPSVFDGTAEPRPVYATTRGAAESWRPPAPRSMLRSGGWKAIYAPLDERIELYDVVADPGEQRDVAAEKQMVALLFRQAFLEQAALDARLLPAGAPTAGEPIDPEVEERLRALGYLGDH